MQEVDQTYWPGRDTYLHRRGNKRGTSVDEKEDLLVEVLVGQRFPAAAGSLVVSSKQIGVPAAAGPIGFPENRGKKAFFLVIEPCLATKEPTLFARRAS